VRNQIVEVYDNSAYIVTLTIYYAFVLYLIFISRRLLIKPTLDFFTLWLAYVAQVLFPIYIVVVLIVVVVTTIQTRDLSETAEL